MTFGGASVLKMLVSVQLKKKTSHKIFFPEPRDSGYKTFQVSCIAAKRNAFTEINDECLNT
jgi:HKD family nuclease